MAMMKLVVQLLVATSCIGPVLSFSPTPSPKIHDRSTPTFSRRLPAVQSAKILPVAYGGASIALVYRAATASMTDKAVLVSTAALSLFNLGPTDNARLASAKRSLKRYPSCTPPSAARKKALKWRLLVRMKIVGQLIGLIFMPVSKSTNGIMYGAATVMATNMLFILGGAGKAMHDNGGAAAPMSTSKSTGLLTVDTVLTIAALLAATSPVDSSRHVKFSCVYAGGAAIGGLEGLIVMIAKLFERKSNLKTRS